jgi:hypothetical protein
VSAGLTRRVFMMRSAAAGCAALAAPGLARAAAHVEESDEAAVALGYRHDSTKVDAAKYPKHQAAQQCANCAFFQGAPADEWAGCAMFGRRQVSGRGWCSAWAARPGG